MTGGAFGSMIAQFFHLTSAERKTLLVAGAAGGMSATFATPVAAILLAVELLLFEWKPRSVVPVALASAAAAVVRRLPARHRPPLPDPSPPCHSSASTRILGCVLVGLLAGALSMLLTMMVYASEDVFHRLPIHWMWWPAIGGLVIGVGGLIFPQALGVGYDTIGALLQGDVARPDDPRHPAGQVDHLGGLARFGHFRRRPRAFAHDGRCARRPRSPLPAQRWASASGPSSAWAPSSAARCAPPSPASSSPSS